MAMTLKWQGQINLKFALELKANTPLYVLMEGIIFITMIAHSLKMTKRFVKDCAHRGSTGNFLKL